MRCYSLTRDESGEVHGRGAGVKEMGGGQEAGRRHCSLIRTSTASDSVQMDWMSSRGESRMVMARLDTRRSEGEGRGLTLIVHTRPHPGGTAETSLAWDGLSLTLPCLPFPPLGHLPLLHPPT